MAVQKGLGGLRRIRLHEAAVAVGQVQHEVVHLALHTGDDRHRLAEITLGVAGRMGQRHEHLLRPPPTLPDVILDYGVLTVEPVLVLEALKDSLGRVALLPGNSAIAFQDRVNHAGEGLQLGSPWRTLAPVARRHRVGQHLAHRVPVQAEHPGGFPNAHAFHHAGPPHLNVHLHWIHPSHPPKADNQPYRRRRAVQFSNAATRRSSHPCGPLYRRRLQILAFTAFPVAHW